MQQLPDMNELMKIARSPAGQQLLAMLRQAGNKSELDAITAEAAAGNMQAAGKKLAAMLTSQEAKALLRQLESQHE
jgi:hypothetical protein